MSAKHDDCTVHLNRVTSALNADARRCLPKGLRFQPVNEADAGDDQEQYNFIKSRSLKLDLQTVDVRERGSSPEPRRKAVAAPKCWEHGHDCTCMDCADFALHDIWISYFVADGERYLRQKNLSECRCVLATVLMSHEGLSSKRLNVAKKLCAFFPKMTAAASATVAHKPKTTRQKPRKGTAIGNDSATALSSHLQSKIVKIRLYFCEIDLLLGNVMQFEASQKDVQSLLSSAVAQRWDCEHHLLLAELTYLGALPALKWPRHAEAAWQSTVDQMCAGIGRLNVDVPASILGAAGCDSRLEMRTPKAASRTGHPSKASHSSSNSENDQTSTKLNVVAGSRRGRKPSAPAAPVKQRTAVRTKSNVVSTSSIAAMQKDHAELPRMSSNGGDDTEDMSKLVMERVSICLSHRGDHDVFSSNSSLQTGES